MRRFRGRRASAVLYLAVGVLMVAAVACGSESDPTATPEAAQTAPTNTPAAAAPTTAPAQPTGAPAQPTATAPADSGGQAVDIANFTLPDLTIEAGTTIQWTNQDGAIHTSTAGEPGSETGTWDSGRLRQGQAFSFTFDQPGTFQYFCQIHPGSMRATVTVTSAGAGAAPTATAPSQPPSDPTATPAPAPPPPPSSAATATPAPAQPAATTTNTPTPIPAATATASPTATPVPPTSVPTATATAEPTATATTEPAAGQSVDVPASKDNTLYQSSSGTLSNGCGDSIYVGRTNGAALRRALVQFDIAGHVPQGATIVSASLKLRVTKTRADSETIALHRVLVGWGEGSSTPNTSGGGSGGSAQEGDATWLHTSFDTEMWTAEGGDFEATPSAEKAVAGTAAWRWTSEQMAADVQQLLDDAPSNYGWILVGNESSNQTAKRFGSRESGNESHRPLLTIEYTGGGAAPTPAAAPTCGSPGAAGSGSDGYSSDS